MIVPALVLRCARCEWRPPPDSVVEAFMLHCGVEHDTDDLQMNLIAVCTCGDEMTPMGSTPAGDLVHVRDSFLCGACGSMGTLLRKPGEHPE